MTPARRWRIVLLVLLVALIACAMMFLFGTDAGARWRTPAHVHAIVHRHRDLAPFLFFLAYVALACSMLPTWWAALIAGYCFGAVRGLVICQLGNATAAFVTVALAEWFAKGASMKRVGPVIEKLRAFQRRLGATGIPLVIGVRAMHFVPFGASNVAFGLMNMPPRDAAIGTLVGNVGVVALYAILGSAAANNGDDETALRWRLIAGVVALNLVLLVPLVVRYRRGTA
jgi:uncharacterized membrane protein YdjX (TVP38/TMEM64 family)